MSSAQDLQVPGDLPEPAVQHYRNIAAVAENNGLNPFTDGVPENKIIDFDNNQTAALIELGGAHRETPPDSDTDLIFLTEVEELAEESVEESNEPSGFRAAAQASKFAEPRSGGVKASTVN